jgi:hypothetical protein
MYNTPLPSRAPISVEKAPYEAPRLLELGDLAELTAYAVSVQTWEEN